MEIKKLLSSWQVWVVAVIVVGVLFIQGFGSIKELLPLAFFLICPVMMFFMMRDHKHK